jgi:hypothetical protein
MRRCEYTLSFRPASGLYDTTRPGSQQYRSNYTGDNNFIGSGPSAPISVTCTAGCSNGTGQTIQLSFYQSTPASGIVTPGETRTMPVDVTPGGGFTGAINLSCSVAGKSSGDQYIPTCSFSPAQVIVTATQAGSSTLTVNTTAATTNMLLHQESRPWYLGGTALPRCSSLKSPPDASVGATC